MSELREVIKSEGGSFGTLRLTDFLSSETLDLTQIIVMVVVKQGLMVVMRGSDKKPWSTISPPPFFVWII